MCASGSRVRQWRNGASADRNAYGAFFELTLRPGRIRAGPLTWPRRWSAPLRLGRWKLEVGSCLREFL